MSAAMLVQVLIIGANAAFWYWGGGFRIAAAVMLVASGVDALFDIPEFAADGDLLATFAEVVWLALGVFALRWLVREVRLAIATNRSLKERR